MNPQINYVIATWDGKWWNDAVVGQRYVLDEIRNPKADEVLALHLDYLSKLKHNLAQITIMRPPKTHDRPKYENYYTNFEQILQTRKFSCPVQIVETDRYTLYSYGQWFHAYELYRDKFDYYIFVEDDTVVSIHYFDAILVRLFQTRIPNELGYLCTKVFPYFLEDIEHKFDPKLERMEHTAISTGITSTKTLSRLFEIVGDPKLKIEKDIYWKLQHFIVNDLNILNHPFSYGDLKQVNFSLMFTHSGFSCIRDYADMFLAPFWARESREKKQHTYTEHSTSKEKNAVPLIMPVTMVCDGYQLLDKLVGLRQIWRVTNPKPRINYVIATWDGKDWTNVESPRSGRHILEQIGDPMPEHILAHHLEYISNLRHNLTQITIMKPNIHNEPRYENYYKNAEEKVRSLHFPCPVVWVTSEFYTLYSYGQWFHAYELYRNKFDYYIFTEDDIVAGVSDFDAYLIELYQERVSQELGYLCTKMFAFSDDYYKPYDVKLRTMNHMAISTGIVNSKTLSFLFQTYKDLYRYLNDYLNELKINNHPFRHGHLMQVNFSLLFSERTSIQDYSDVFSCPFWMRELREDKQHVHKDYGTGQMALFIPVTMIDRVSNNSEIGKYKMETKDIFDKCYRFWLFAKPSETYPDGVESIFFVDNSSIFKFVNNQYVICPALCDEQDLWRQIDSITWIIRDPIPMNTQNYVLVQYAMYECRRLEQSFDVICIHHDTNVSRHQFPGTLLRIPKDIQRISSYIVTKEGAQKILQNWKKAKLETWICDIPDLHIFTIHVSKNILDAI